MLPATCNPQDNVTNDGRRPLRFNVMVVTRNHKNLPDLGIFTTKSSGSGILTETPVD
jgi:hypothetical protein